MATRHVGLGIAHRRNGLLGAICLVAFGSALALPSAGKALVAAGHDRSCAADVSGGLRCWGDNSSGALGNGVALHNPVPAAVSGFSSGVSWIASSAAAYHTCALKGPDVWCWGHNFYGQAGNGTFGSSNVPTRVVGLPSGIAAVGMGAFHSCAVTAAGAVLCWGFNERGQLGSATVAVGGETAVPGAVNGLPAPARAIAAGRLHTCALLQSGDVMCWGGNDFGQLGTGSTADAALPTKVQGLPAGVLAITAGFDHTCAIAGNGSAWCWGANALGQLGTGFRSNSTVALPVSGLAAGVAQLSGGGSHTCARLTDGRVSCWGGNFAGQLGVGDPTGTPAFAPLNVSALPSPASSISVGAFTSCAIVAAGAVSCWGDNSDGQFGNGNTTSSDSPVAATALAEPVISITTGEANTCALTSAGKVLCWGRDSFFELGSASRTVGRSTPAPVTTLASSVSGIAMGGSFACALKESGDVLCWGDDGQGQLGAGFSPTGSLAPDSATPMATLATGIASISAGRAHVCAVNSAAGALCWGDNRYGQLGRTLASGNFFPAPIPVPGHTSDIAAIAAGEFHTCAVTTVGQVLCWGYGLNGQLGNGALASSAAPVGVRGLDSGVKSVAAGGLHTCALNESGGVVCWGSNSNGQLGNATTRDSATPVAVTGLASGVAAIAAGGTHSCALTVSGGVLCWGSNAFGQLGNGGLADSSVPVGVAGFAAGAASVSAGTRHTCVLAAVGDALCWGFNTDGELGDSTFAGRVVPVVVVRDNGTGSLSTNDWFLDLDPSIAKTIPADKVPPFGAVSSGSAASAIVDVTTSVRFRAQDVGQAGSVFAFAIVPSSVAKSSTSSEPALVLGRATQGAGKDGGVACVLAQLDASGQLHQVSAAGLQALFSGLLSSQGQSVTVLNGVNSLGVAGATFYVGYGSSAAAMLNGGLNRSVVSIPGPSTCSAPIPQTGWWWNPAESGRGYSIEASGGKIFMAAYLYDNAGRSTWYSLSASASLDGWLYAGDLVTFAGGQTLTGAFKSPTLPPTVAGTAFLAFNDSQNASIALPGGSPIAITRFAFGASGAQTTPLAGQPENGWWWNSAESGRGYFIEWQGNIAYLAAYMYEADGHNVWYVAPVQAQQAQSLAGTWSQFGNGQTLSGPYRAPTPVNAAVGAVTIQFSAADKGTMTLPDGRAIPIGRFRF